MGGRSGSPVSQVVSFDNPRNGGKQAFLVASAEERLRSLFGLL
jgi:hypothetical protein